MKTVSSIIPLGVIAICILIYFYYISPTIGEVKALSMKNDEYNGILLKAQELAAKRDAILNEYNSIPQADLDKLSKIIPADFNSTLFVNDLNNLAVQNGLSVKNMKYTELGAGDSGVIDGTLPPFKTYIVQLSVKGPFLQFIKFLNALETNIRLIDVNTLSIRYAKDEKATVDSSEYSLEVNVYALR